MEAMGPILVVLAIPLIPRWIPQNLFYGLSVRQHPRQHRIRRSRHTTSTRFYT